MKGAVCAHCSVRHHLPPIFVVAMCAHHAIFGCTFFVMRATMKSVCAVFPPLPPRPSLAVLPLCPVLHQLSLWERKEEEGERGRGCPPPTQEPLLAGIARLPPFRAPCHRIPSPLPIPLFFVRALVLSVVGWEPFLFRRTSTLCAAVAFLVATMVAMVPARARPAPPGSSKRFWEISAPQKRPHPFPRPPPHVNRVLGP